MDLTTALPDVPAHVRRALLDEYAKALEAHVRGDPSAASSHASKVCDWVIRAIDPPLAELAPDRGYLREVKVEAWCRAVEDGSKTGRGISIELARTIRAINAIRNRRGVAHTGMSPKEMDAVFTIACARWAVAELVANQINLTADEASGVVDELIGIDAEASFIRILGHRFARYRRSDPLERPNWLADREALSAMRTVSDLGLLGGAKLGYLYTSAIHQKYDIDFWFGEISPTSEVADSVAWLATFLPWSSAERALGELRRFPSAVRDSAKQRAASELYAIDHPERAREEDARALMDALKELRCQIEELPRSDMAALELLGSGDTRRLINQLKAVLPSTEPSASTDRIERGSTLDEAAVGFIVALCAYLKHRDFDMWRHVDQQSAASAAWLGDIVARPARDARFCAGAELALYAKPLRHQATADGCRSDDQTTREISAAARTGREAMLVLVTMPHPVLTGKHQANVRKWVVARYAKAVTEEEEEA